MNREQSERWAARYVNESEAYPTDREIAKATVGCVKPPKPESYEAIRSTILELYGNRVSRAGWVYRDESA